MALVVNDSMNLQNQDYIRLFLKSVFDGSLSWLNDGLFVYLLPQIENLKNQETVLDKIEEFYRQELHQADATLKPYFLQQQSILLRHRIDIARNKLAYSAKGVKNAYNQISEQDPTAVVWPDPTHPSRPSHIKDILPKGPCKPLVNKTTPIGSAGSCFANEIALHLRQAGFHYLTTETKNSNDTCENLTQYCCRWGPIYNVPAFRQMVEWSFGLRELEPVLWSVRQGEKTVYHDPYREEITYSSVEEYHQDRLRHRECSKEALSKVKVFVMTLGLNEVWLLKSDGSVFARCPWRIASGLVTHKIYSVEENLHELKTMLNVWRQFNPGVQIIVTVSPVPLHATFRAHETHIVQANCHAKSVLRVVAEEFASTCEEVYYFPAYETVMYCADNPWEADLRHVRREAVAKVMQVFDSMFVETE